MTVLDPHPALLGRVHEEESAEGPVGLAADRLFRLLVEENHLAAGVDELRGRGEPREARSDHDHVCVVGHGPVLSACRRLRSASAGFVTSRWHRRRLMRQWYGRHQAPVSVEQAAPPVDQPLLLIGQILRQEE